MSGPHLLDRNYLQAPIPKVSERLQDSRHSGDATMFRVEPSSDQPGPALCFLHHTVLVFLGSSAIAVGLLRPLHPILTCSWLQGTLGLRPHCTASLRHWPPFCGGHYCLSPANISGQELLSLCPFCSEESRALTTVELGALVALLFCIFLIHNPLTQNTWMWAGGHGCPQDPLCHLDIGSQAWSSPSFPTPCSLRVTFFHGPCF